MRVKEIVIRLLEDHIDINSWPPRKAELTLLVAVLMSVSDGPVPITPKTIQDALGRSYSQARYDQGTMADLERDGVLRCHPGAGRRPHSWWVNDDIAAWHVPWSTSQKAAVQEASETLSRARLPLSRDRAGQSVSRRVKFPENGPKSPGKRFQEILTWAFAAPDHAATVVARATTENVNSKGAGQSVDVALESGELNASTAPSYSAFDVSSKEETSLSLLEGREGGSGSPSEGTSKAGLALVLAIEETIGCPVAGKFRTRVAALADANPDRIAELMAAARWLSGIRTAKLAAEKLEERFGPDQPVPEAVDPGALEAEIVRRSEVIATLRREGAEDEHLAPFNAKLAELKSLLAVTREG